MSLRSHIDSLSVAAYSAYASTTQALPKRRVHYPQWSMRVVGVTDVAPMVRRITFQAPEFATWEVLGPDEYFGLMLPPHGAPLVLPDPDLVNTRRALCDIDAAHRPNLRYYTIRKHDAAASTICVDMVRHDAEGPAGSWLESASTGQEAGFRAGSAAYPPEHGDTPHLICGDETAMPAIAGIADAQTPAHTTIALELPDDRYLPHDFPTAKVHIIYRGEQPPGAALITYLEQHILTAPGYAWVCCEQGAAADIRRLLVKNLHTPRRNVMFSGYWRLDAARG